MSEPFALVTTALSARDGSVGVRRTPHLRTSPPAGGAARPAGVDGGANPAVGGRHDRRGLDDAAGRLPQRSPGGFLPWALLVAGSAASLAANVAVAEATVTGRM